MNTETARESLHPFFSTENLRETLAARLPGPAFPISALLSPPPLWGTHVPHLIALPVRLPATESFQFRATALAWGASNKRSSLASAPS